MSITASQVKELREITGAGMMECKTALTEVNGDIDAAVELMRKKGQAKAAKKSGRIAAEGVIQIAVSPDAKHGVMVEINCETDFVAREAAFVAFAKRVAEIALAKQTTDVAALVQLPMDQESHQTIEERRQELVVKIGENIQIRRIAFIHAQGRISQYIHSGRIGVIVDVEGPDDLAKGVAMHIAASRPEFVQPEQVPETVIAKEKEIYTAQAADSGKPADIVEKMVLGRIKKFLAEVSLYGQPFIMDPNKTVAEVLKAQSTVAHHFVRYEVGEGIEKEETNFAEEVKAQAGIK